MTVEDEVRAVSAAWDAALISNDAPLVASFMTDDWAYVGPDGTTPKADLIVWIASGRLAHHTMATVAKDRVARAGDTVLVTARKMTSGRWDDVEHTADGWISDIYVHAHGRWLCALSQEPRLTRPGRLGRGIHKPSTASLTTELFASSSAVSSMITRPSARR